MKKSFEEFREEVYRRRDEEKALQAKKRKMMVTLGVPLVLMLSLGFLFYPGFMMAQSKDAAMENTSSISIRDMSTASYRVTISYGETELVWEADDPAASAVTFLLLGESEDFSDIFDGSEAKPESDSAAGSSNGTESVLEQEEISFILTDENGENIRFYLEAGTLLRLDTGEERVLTGQELEHLFTLLP